MSSVAAGLLLAAAVGAVVRPRSRARLTRLGPRGIALARITGAAQRILARAEVSRGLAVGGGCMAAGGAGILWYGPAAGVVCAAYGGMAVHVALRRRFSRAAHRALVGALDGVATLVADLRAGVPPAAALGAARRLLIDVRAGEDAIATVADLDGHVDGTARGRLLSRVVAAWRLAEHTGAPLADVLERLDDQVRAGERARALAAGHAASARATAVLLAGLPLAGVGLGYGIGADPLAVLFGTPVGGACAVIAVALQLAGLVWVGRLARIDPDRVEPLEPGR